MIKILTVFFYSNNLKFMLVLLSNKNSYLNSLNCYKNSILKNKFPTKKQNSLKIISNDLLYLNIGLQWNSLVWNLSKTINNVICHKWKTFYSSCLRWNDDDSTQLILIWSQSQPLNHLWWRRSSIRIYFLSQKIPWRTMDT